MFHIRNPIFQKYEKKEDRYKNGPSFIPTPFWKEMVDKWMAGDWGEKLDAIKAKAVSEGTKKNDYQIFHQVLTDDLSASSLGMGIGIKAKDVYDLTSSGIGCSKRCREDFTKEKEDLEARLREEMDSKLAKVVEKLEENFAQKLQSMGIPQQFDIDAATTDGSSRDEEDNSNNNIVVENNLESESEED
ncbi:hypothetical protein SO802_013037 [Lithocarpus litseifolius]|uniref:Transposase n=1 Tax=Lithocarpus litseifolius TaxID=425828 RepID=A0AAW2D8I5_9ROSI